MRSRERKMLGWREDGESKESMWGITVSGAAAHGSFAIVRVTYNASPGVSVMYPRELTDMVKGEDPSATAIRSELDVFNITSTDEGGGV